MTRSLIFALTFSMAMSIMLPRVILADEPTLAPGEVLRHLVFMKFAEDADAEAVKEIKDTFDGLPNEIKTIADYQSGTNNSPEGLDDEFTHAFAVTFNSAEDLAAYGPHAAHQNLVGQLKGTMESVFVFDYVGNDDSQIDSDTPGIKHCVFFKFKDDADPAGVTAVEEAFEALPSKIKQIKGFEWGKAVNAGKSTDGFTHCFFVAFNNDAARAVYLPHPDHLAFVEVLKPVLDKVRVIDFDSKE